ncbi:hypothetical protein ACJX0J_020876, partial [Zea mays]
EYIQIRILLGFNDMTVGLSNRPTAECGRNVSSKNRDENVPTVFVIFLTHSLMPLSFPIVGGTIPESGQISNRIWEVGIVPKNKLLPKPNIIREDKLVDTF